MPGMPMSSRVAAVEAVAQVLERWWGEAVGFVDNNQLHVRVAATRPCWRC